MLRRAAEKVRHSLHAVHHEHLLHRGHRRRHTSAPFWFQLYMMRDRNAMANMIERARAARCSALVLTLDLQVIGQRHKDLKNGLTAPPRPTLANIINLATKPRWC